MKIRSTTCLFLALLLSICIAAPTDENAALRRAPLMGLRGIGTNVIAVKFDGDAGLDKRYQSQLETALELALRRNGIRICQGNSWRDEPGMPTIEVLLMRHALTWPRVYELKVSLDVTGKLEYSGRTTVATVWEDSLWIDDPAEPQEVVTKLEPMLIKFCNDYLAANPKDDKTP